MKVDKKAILKNGLLLDVGCRDRKEINWLGIDWKLHPGVDIVHDLEKFPYPIPDESCITIKAAHVAEHIAPRVFFGWMDEMWRMLKPDGQLVLSAPYAGSIGFWGDPTHINGITEVTFQHFDPDLPLYAHYSPKPWNIEHATWHVNGNIEAVLRKRCLNSAEEIARGCINHYAMQKLSELTGLFSLVMPLKPSVVVEIGTARGGVLHGLCRISSDDAKIVSIDLPGGDFGGGYTEEEQIIMGKYGRKGQSVKFLRLDSHKEDTKKKLERILGGKKIDFLFIDGDHTLEGVSMDYQMYHPLVRKGGIIAFHDILPHPTVPSCQVDKFWKKVKKGRKTKEFIDADDKTWGGIGVILT
jgi:predicted O-methyltransferase YrrM